MLARLRIRQKLSLLLMIPLAALVLVMVPFTTERIGDARSAQTTANIARAAREIGTLIQALQQERLLAMGYLSSPNLDRAALVAQSETARDVAARLAADPLTASAVSLAARELDALTPLRREVVTRVAGAQRTYDLFRDATTALLDALRLSSPAGADVQGLSQLEALDALMRSNEEVTSAGAILVADAGELDVDRRLISSTLVLEVQHIARFGRLVSEEQAEFVASVDGGQAGGRFYDLVRQTVEATAGSPVEVSAALTAALSYTGLRRLAQDRTAREIAAAAQTRANTALVSAIVVVSGAVVVFAAVTLLGVTVSRSISRPLRRLTRAAAVVTDVARNELVRVSDSDSPDPAPPRLAAIDVDSEDEIGELAAALNRVQATAALLIERQISTRGNTAVMFANIARRTQNLVGRQLTLIDDLERNERNPVLLQRLYRLDHVATRLRRSADSLLVVSGTIDQIISGGPTPLIDVVRSALSEIEGFRAVKIGEIPDVAVSAAVAGDLRLMLAELMENATNFSPPGSLVQVSAHLGEDCRISIVDRGVGMSSARLEEENRRLVDRERLDVAPTTVLGLFVVGRLARRHGLTVRLDPSDERGITAAIRLPVRLLSAVTTEVRARLTPARMRPLPPEIEAIEAINGGSREPFAWFERQELVAISATPEPTVAPQVIGRASVTRVSPVYSSADPPRRPAAAPGEGTGDGETTAELSRRVPGTHMIDAVRSSPEEPPTERIVRDPEAERAAMNDYLSGLARGAGAAEPEPKPTSTLAERHS